MNRSGRSAAPLDDVHGGFDWLGERRSPVTRRVVHVAGLACAVWLVAFPARADKMTDAEELFRRAKGLMAENKYRDACPLLEESERLDPQMGTLLNLAICHETVGKIASAWGEFRAVEQQARTANREDRVKLAHERAAKLEPRLPRIKLIVPPDAKVAGLAIKVDGEGKGEPLWSGIVVDPGIRTVEVSAPGKEAATLKVKVEEEGSVVSVTVPKLEEDLAPKPKTGPDGGVPIDHGREREREEQYAANRSRRTTGVVVGGIGAATAVVGGVFGVLAILGNGDASEACPRPCIAGSTEAKAADDATDRALLFANVTNVVLPIGLIAAAIGSYMFLTAGPTEASPKTARALLSPRPGGASFGVSW